MMPRETRILRCALCISLCVSACAPAAPAPPATVTSVPPTPTAALAPTARPNYDATPLPTREPFAAEQSLPYVTQTGDTVTAIAAHFNTTPEEVVAANPALPLTGMLPPGMTLMVPAYWFSLGGTAFKIIPDSRFVYGPADKDFDIDEYVQAQPGYLWETSAFVAERHRTSAQTVLYVARQYSISPRLLLALMEWRTGALTQRDVPPEIKNDPFGPIEKVSGLYAQLRYVAEQLSIGYYGWRTGELTSLLLRDSTRSRVDMYQNAGTVGVQYLFAQLFSFDEFQAAAGPQGFAATYLALWGNPFEADPVPEGLIPGNLSQPELALPFTENQTWAFTGGPHPGWGANLPWSALDFAPPAGATGCINTDKWVTAAAPGVVVRSDDNTLVLDLDGDGYEQTGWVLFHFHMSSSELATVGTAVQTGGALGHPSCEGGTATGTHVHIARKYNGEWIPADGVIPFVLGGWTAQNGDAPYQGRMMRVGAWVEACTCSTASNTVYWAR